MKKFNLSILSKVFLFVFVVIAFFFLSANLPNSRVNADCLNVAGNCPSTHDSYRCTGTGNNCEEFTKACHDGPTGACTVGPHLNGLAQNLCCPGGGSCNNGACTTTSPPTTNACTSLGTGYNCYPSSTCVGTDPTANAYCANLTAGNTCCIPPAAPGPGPGPAPVTAPSTGCAMCDPGWAWNPPDCTKTVIGPNGLEGITPSPPTMDPSCTSTSRCYPGCGCKPCGNNTTFQTGQLPCPGGTCNTAIGAIQTNFSNAIQTIFQTLLAISSLIAMVLIIFSAYRLLASQGNPENVQKAREQLTAAIVGLLFTIFAFVILQLIGYNLLRLPGLNF